MKKELLDAFKMILAFPFIVIGYLLYKIFIFLKTGWVISRDFD